MSEPDDKTVDGKPGASKAQQTESASPPPQLRHQRDQRTESTEQPNSQAADAQQTTNEHWVKFRTFWAGRWTNEHIEFVFSGVVMLTAVVGAFAVVYSGCLTRDALEETRRANVAANQSAAAAIEANQIAREIMAKAEIDAEAQDARHQEQLQLARDSATAARDSAAAARTTADSAKSQAAATQRLAEATIAFNEQSRLVFQESHRAKLSMSVGTVKLPDATGAWEIRFPLNNAGNSAAQKIRVWRAAGFGAPKTTAVLADSAWMGPVTIGDVLPGEKDQWIRADGTLNAAQVKRFTDGEDFYLFLRLRYCDTFRIAHWIHHCWHAGQKTPSGPLISCGDSSGDETAVASKAECQ